MLRLTTAWCFNWFNPFVFVPVGYLPFDEEPTVAPGPLSRVFRKLTRNTPCWDWSRIKGMRIDPFSHGVITGAYCSQGAYNGKTDFEPMIL